MGSCASWGRCVLSVTGQGLPAVKHTLVWTIEMMLPAGSAGLSQLAGGRMVRLHRSGGVPCPLEALRLTGDLPSRCVAFLGQMALDDAPCFFSRSFQGPIL